LLHKGQALSGDRGNPSRETRDWTPDQVRVTVSCPQIGRKISKLLQNASDVPCFEGKLI
jgi:hypothetical protein